MKITLLWCLILISVIGCNTKPDGLLYPKLWVGHVSWKDQRVTVYLGFEKSWIGKLYCNGYIPEQAGELKSDACRVDGDSLFIQFTGDADAAYIGKIGKKHINGWWMQNGLRIPLNLQKSGLTKYQLLANQAIHYAKEESLNRNAVDWDKIKQRVMELSEKADSDEELIPALHFILESLEDKHGFVLKDQKYSSYIPKDNSRISPALRRAAYKNDKYIVADMLSESIAYLRVPTSPGSSLETDESFNRELQKQVCDLISKGAKNWIVDVRLNYGGNMFDMLGGVNRIVGDGRIGATADRDGNELDIWEMKRGNFHLNDKQITSSGSTCSTSPQSGRIAVLTGPITVSSGEALAIALRSKDNCMVFGESSYGFTTSTTGRKLSKELFFFFSVNFYSDGQGRVYRKGIDPDIRVDGGDNFTDIHSDAKVKAATKWLNGIRM